MILEINNLVKRYNGLLAVDNVDLAVTEGEVFGLLGPNGAGKTTLINAIIGMTKTDGGEINLFGKNLRRSEMEIKANIGIVPQEIALYGDLNALQNVEFFGKLYGVKGDLLQERAKEALDFVDLWERRKDSPNKFSGGMKRRLNIACSLVHHPKLIIMDEPTVGIDPQSRNHILESVKKLNQMGSTVIYTSHYMEEVEVLCNDIAIMDHGRIIARGSKEELEEMVAVEEKVNIRLSSVNYSLVENVKKISGVTNCLLEHNQLTVFSRAKSNNISRIIECITQTGAVIEAINMEKLTLEDVFLTLTGRTLRN
ncbi:ABC transporter ATP-binding protein [Dethiobacter alkaliphilus]|uniref:ABC transporter related protein n=1 Tax=Dethiobacter alkaliphilus AHT 1 TaxID=555088 RepID=C0GHZ6_DETAL|nr:ABC transporter ATP-binding protein [Dethiobacter alkaliphilus]EEG77070.1 ABC transporter related protein [Dethiobacter alkaliphilus AHT 1]